MTVTLKVACKHEHMHTQTHTQTITPQVCSSSLNKYNCLKNKYKLISNIVCGVCEIKLLLESRD
jgi:hypothetical protein